MLQRGGAASSNPSPGDLHDQGDQLLKGLVDRLGAVRLSLKWQSSKNTTHPEEPSPGPAPFRCQMGLIDENRVDQSVRICLLSIRPFL